MAKGLDSPTSLLDVAHCLADDGYSFACRYYFQASSYKERLSAEEARALTDAGLYIVSIFESGYPTTAAYFNSTSAGNHWPVVRDCMAQAGQPNGTVVGFAVDYDCTDPEILKPYFQTLRIQNRAAGEPIKLGVYGSGLVCQYLQGAGLVSHTWLAQSPGWERGGFNAADSIVQGKETTYRGRGVDLDMTSGDAGWGWKVTGTK